MSSLAAVRKIGVERVGIVDRKAINADKRTTKLFVPRDALSTLNLIDRGRFVELPDEGERAFFVIGDVEVGYANLIDDHDRLLPSKAADALADDARVYLHPTVKLNQSHLAEFAKARGLRSPTEKERYNDNYCKFDELSKRWFYRSAFIELVKQAMRDFPLEAARDLKLGAKQRSALEAKARSTQPLAEAEPRRKSEAATG